MAAGLLLLQRGHQKLWGTPGKVTGCWQQYETMFHIEEKGHGSRSRAIFAKQMFTLPRNSQIWMPGYIKDRFRVHGREAAKRVWVVFADHFEPLWNAANEDVARERVEVWARLWPEIAARFQDSAGRPPRYTFFYPEEEYRPHLLAPLAEMTRQGVGDVEVHLHHDGEGEQNFVDRMSSFKETLVSRHGLLRKQDGKTVFGFIHGNWALDNSSPDGRRCGLNNEITLLRDLGCYADFTMPSAPSPTQASLVNTIYWAVDDPEKPKSYDTGIPVIPGVESTGDLLMIPGPLGMRWRDRLLPRMENGELASYNLSTQNRAHRWLELAPRIAGDIFLKLFLHGAQERHSKALLNGGLASALDHITHACRESGYELHFVSAWEMRQAVDVALQIEPHSQSVRV
jgi:hypothetical protein